MNVVKLMSIDPACHQAHETLADAARDMWDCDCGCIPVVDNEQRVIGMITDRDICMAALFKGRPIQEISIGDVMSRVAITCRSDDTIQEAERIMREARVRRLPVTDETDRLIGVISLNDIALEAESERSSRTPQVTLNDVALTLSAVCHQRATSNGSLARFEDLTP
ncbi:MAG TPA: CBS domain-containing protein [Polyangiaceae bacterium]|nr:CBS domain-containing protein [Polyangiaceae bacterium]